MSRRLRSRSIIAALPLLLTLLGAAPASATSPTVIYGQYDGLLAINSGSFAGEIVMPIPVGTWWVTVTAMLSNDAASYVTGEQTQCELDGPAGATDRTSVLLTSGATGRSHSSMYLTILATSSSMWDAALSCRTDAGAGEIHLSVMRFTAVEVFTSGTNSPQARFRATVGAAHTGDNTYHTLNSLNLPAGRWWILGKADVANDAPNATSHVSCQLSLGTDLDRTQVGLYDTGQQGNTEEEGVQIAHGFSSAGRVNLQCKSASTFTTTYERIFAIKTGKLTRKAFGGASSTSGSGTPLVISGYEAASVNIASGTFKTVESLSLPAGAWYVQAKAVLTDGAAQPVECQLVVATDNDLIGSYGGPTGSTGLYLQTAHELASAGSAKLQCRVLSGGASLSYIRITAISVGSLSPGILEG